VSDIPSQTPTGELVPGITDENRDEILELSRLGIGEGDFDDPHLPDDFDWSAPQPVRHAIPYRDDVE
jgi:hypothetical protein